MPLHRLVDHGVEEERKDDRRGAVDGHRHRRSGIEQVEAGVELLRVVDGADRYPRGTDLAVDVGTLVGVAAVQRHAVEGGREAHRRLPTREQVEALVGALGRTLASKHP